MASSMAENNRIKVPTERKALHILDKDAFKGNKIEPEIVRQTQVNFYRGAPPVWLNFHLAEQNPKEDAFIKRNGYEELHREILAKRSGNLKTSYVRLTHEPGSGGTTLAMQLLWDLRKSFRCAVLVDPKSESTATEVIDLYTGNNYRKTVLLLVQDGDMYSLRQSVMQQMSEREIHSDTPIVIILNCERRALTDANELEEYSVEDSVEVSVENVAENTAKPDGVLLRRKLSDKENDQFHKKRKILCTKFPDEHPQFHGFNIMQKNFCKDYAKKACEVLKSQVSNRGLRLTACMCLLNSYVPGSFFFMNNCEKFLQTAFEQTMQPFSHLMVIFNPDGRDEKHVRMAHPMIAEQGTLSLHDAGMYRSDMAQYLLNLLGDCGDTHPLKLFVKDLLIKRGKGIGLRSVLFSKLILDIQKATGKGNKNCVSVLERGVKEFPTTGSFPQTLSRFYYLKCQDYCNAETWAEKAKETDPTNSFFADTLAQVYKHNLQKDIRELFYKHDTLLEMLDLANKAFEAFDHEENLAENEPESTSFNFRGKIGYFKVATTLFCWKGVLQILLTEEIHHLTYENLISPLPDVIKKKAIFLSMLLTYSQKGLFEKDPYYVWREARNCYRYYHGEALPKYLGTGPTEDLLHRLHQNWPKDTQETQEPIQFNFKETVESMRCSFQTTHEKYVRSRYLLPLCYLESEGTKVRVPGQVKNYNVYTFVAGEEIQLDVDPPQILVLRKSGPVSFHLGFTIRGPTAYDITYKDAEK